MLCLKVNVKDVLNYVASLNWCFLNLQVTETNPCCAKDSWTLILMRMWEPEGAQWQEEDTRRRQPEWSVHLDSLGVREHCNVLQSFNKHLGSGDTYSERHGYDERQNTPMDIFTFLQSLGFMSEYQTCFGR